VRHRPPFQLAPWVVEAEGRRQRLGTALECGLCDPGCKRPPAGDRLDVKEIRPDQEVGERIARNDAMFRAANERLAATPAHLQADDPLIFLCECADLECTTIIRVPRAEYRLVRSKPRWFVCAPDHEPAANGSARLVREAEGYVVVEKTGRAGEIAEELDDKSRGDGRG
jgi:hypothetical protein